MSDIIGKKKKVKEKEERGEKQRKKLIIIMTIISRFSRRGNYEKENKDEVKETS